MKTKEKIDFDKIIQGHILNNKHVVIYKHNGIIVDVDSFENKEELIKLSEDFFHDGIYYLTGEEAYIKECNSNYQDYLQSIIDDSLEDKTEIEKKNILQEQIISYNEFNKGIQRDDYVDGFYEWTDLIGKLNFPEPTKLSCTCYFGDISGDVTIEIY